MNEFHPMQCEGCIMSIYNTRKYWWRWNQQYNPYDFEVALQHMRDKRMKAL